MKPTKEEILKSKFKNSFLDLDYLELYLEAMQEYAEQFHKEKLREEWISIKDRLPEEGRLVIAWCGDGYKICKYRKYLTWKGWKLTFVNIMSKGFEADDVTHWMYFPKPPKDSK